MTVQGFKNLVPRNLLNDDSCQPLVKKTDDYRRLIQSCIDHFINIGKSYEQYYVTSDKLVTDLMGEFESQKWKVPHFYREYIQLYKNINGESKLFSERLAINFKELSNLCNNMLSGYSNVLVNFQQNIRTYKSREMILFELSKKYWRTHKHLLAGIESYKSTFTDVKIIYNMDEKIKRYNACESTYKNLEEDLAVIQEKMQGLEEDKLAVSDKYKHLIKELSLTLKSSANKIISLTKMFVNQYCQKHKILLSFFAERLFTLEKMNISNIFCSMENTGNPEIFNIQIITEEVQIIPRFIKFHKNIKDEYLFDISKFFFMYLKEISERVEQRKAINKKMLEFTMKFYNFYQKIYYHNLKEIIANFQKIKKKVSEVFGNRMVSFMKSIHSIFELSIGINEKLIKFIAGKLKNLENLNNQQSKLLDFFMKELKGNVQKFFKKKDVKRMSSKEIQFFSEEEPSTMEIDLMRQELSSKAEFVIHLIEGFAQKMDKNYLGVQEQFTSIIRETSGQISRYHSMCCEYQELYFGQDEFIKNFKKFEADIDNAMLLERKFFEEISLGVFLKEEKVKITFEAEVNKVDEFKKMKKPIEIEVQSKNIETVRKSSDFSDEAQSLKKSVNITGQKEKVESKGKYEDFLRGKLSFLEGESLIGTYSCALSDKIILQGRLFITNSRLCFHSKFNASTVFFGGTFLQIPKKDIKKVEKRANAILFDNSISITTVNGEVFLTSFFSRNEAYDKIINSMDLHADEEMFEPQQEKEEEEEIELVCEEEDDINESEVASRTDILNGKLNIFDYKFGIETEFSYPGLNALKFFKMFELDQQVKINRKVFANFAIFYKEAMEHKDYTIGRWDPEVAPFLNKHNIKKNMPLLFSKNVECMVPVPPSGVPFMPKFTKSQEKQTLYFYSKDKFVMESIIQNSGVPYADTFNLRLKKTLQSKEEGKCRYVFEYFVNFTSSTMMKSIIQSKSGEETKAAAMRFEQEAKKYLANLLKSKSKKNIGVEGAKVQQVQEYEKEIDGLKDSQQKLSSEIRVYKERLQLGKKVLIGSVVLNILLILILLN